MKRHPVHIGLRRGLWLAFVVTGFSIQLVAQAPNADTLSGYATTQKLSPPQVRADLLLFRQALEEAQTPIYRYASREKVQSALNDLIRSATDSMTYLQLIQRIAAVQHLIACGHSNWDHASGYLSYRSKHIGLFPLDIAIIDQRYFIRQNLSDREAIPDHAEISHINGIPVKQLTARIRNYMPQDGHSNPDGVLEIAQSFKYAYSNFIETPDRFTVRIHSPGTPATDFEVRALLLSEQDSIKRVRYGADHPKPKPLKFSYVDSIQTGMLSIGSFSNEVIARYGQSFVPFIDSVFAVMQAKQARNLIIDIRGNRGGWTANGKHLFAYFIEKETPYIRNVEVQNGGPYRFAGAITQWPGYDDTTTLLKTGERYAWVNNPNLLALPQSANRFRGRVFILTDGFTRSAAAVFSALMRTHTRALFVGEETGAAQCGPNGMVMEIRLPYSRIGISLSTAQYNLAVKDETDSRGIRPDWRVMPDVNSITRRVDLPMERIRKYLASH